MMLRMLCGRRVWSIVVLVVRMGVADDDEADDDDDDACFEGEDLMVVQVCVCVLGSSGV